MFFSNSSSRGWGKMYANDLGQILEDLNGNLKLFCVKVQIECYFTYGKQCFTLISVTR